MSSFNINPDVASDDDGSTMGIDLLLNPKKYNLDSDGSNGRGGGGGGGGGGMRPQPPSPAMNQFRVGASDSGSDIEVVSTGGEHPTFRTNRAVSDVSEESDWKPPRPQAPTYSNEEIMNQKREMLYQFDRLERKGMKVPKKFTMSSSIDEMKVELERLKRDKDVDAAVRFQRRMLMACVTGVEFLNERFDPFAVKLDGWSESTQENISDYDDVFEELYDKYKGSAKLAPELRLMFMVGGSAVWFHISNSVLKTSFPGVEQIFKQNPELRKQFAEATLNTMSQKPGGGAGAGFGGLMGLFGGMGGGGEAGSSHPAMSQPAPIQRVHMKGPTNVDDLLNELKEENFETNDNHRLEVFSNASESDMTDMPDDASIKGLFSTKQRKSGSGKRRTLDI